MALAWYNGFSPEQRDRSQKWLNAQFAAGLVRPTRCEACWQTEGALDYHTEDYSDPFGPHIHGFQLCYRCHLSLHCRRHNAAAWELYRKVIRDGYRFPPMGRNWGQLRSWLSKPDTWRSMLEMANDPTEATLLDEIEAGVHNPNHGREDRGNQVRKEGQHAQPAER